MTIKAIFEEGAFKPLSRIKNLHEGQIIEIRIEAIKRDNLAELTMCGGSFDFLDDDENIYSEKDLIENAKRRHNTS